MGFRALKASSRRITVFTVCALLGYVIVNWQDVSKYRFSLTRWQNDVISTPITKAQSKKTTDVIHKRSTRSDSKTVTGVTSTPVLITHAKNATNATYPPAMRAVSMHTSGEARLPLHSAGNLSGASSWSGENNLTGKKDLVDTSKLNRSDAYRLINGLVRAGRLDFCRVASYHLADEWLTPMDKEILADEPVKDLTTVASSETSLLEAAPLPRSRVVGVGDEVTVRVILKDAKGRPVLKGGHEVTVWMVGKDARRRAAAVDVKDLRNGTYVATLAILWSGEVEVRAALLRPRQFRRVLLTLLDTMKMMQMMTAAFVSERTEQVTLCSFIPVIPGFPEVCNLTSLNSGMPWYCGKPSKPGLACHHWAFSFNTDLPRHFPVSDAENRLMAEFVNVKLVLKRLKQRLLLTALPGKKSDVIKPCVPLQPRDTWTDQSPRGYWEKKEWHPLTGCPQPQLNTSVANQCLRDTSIIMVGDSNARKVVERLQSVLKCRQRADPKRPYQPNVLQVPHHFDRLQSNIRLSWYPHAYPYYTGILHWSDARVKNSPSAILDKLPSSGKHVILIHLFMHYAREHTSVLALHVRDTARAVRDLLQRNPDVKVFIRGPHFIGVSKYCVTCDWLSERLLRILRHEFRDLRDHVVLLNTWDMTVALENCEAHPDPGVVDAIIRMVLAHVCPLK